MGKKRWAVLALCCVLLMSVAVLYAWSVFVIPLEGIYSWSRVETSGVFTLSMCSYCAGSLLSGFLSARLRPRTLLWCAGGALLPGFLLAGGSTPSFAGVALGYGVLCGCGVGMAYNILLGYAARWFPDRPGSCNGLLLTCYGFATFPMAAAANHLLSALGWTRTLLAFGLFEGSVLILGGLLLPPSPTPVPSEPGAPGSSADLSPAQMLRTGRFCSVFLWLMVLTAGGLAAIGSAAQMALELGAAAGTAALLSGVVTAFGCAGRLAFGRLFDMLGGHRSALWDSLIMAVAMALMVISFLLDRLPLLLLGLGLLGIGYGGMSSLCAALVRDLFGPRH